MNLSGKKLTTAILAGLMGATVAGISVVGAVNQVVLDGTTLKVSLASGEIKPIMRPVNVTNGIKDGTTTGGQIVKSDSTVGANLDALDVAVVGLQTKVDNAKVDTALHVNGGNLIVGTKPNQVVNNAKINGKFTAENIDVKENITAGGDITAKGKVTAAAVVDNTTQKGNYVKDNVTVGKNLDILDDALTNAKVDTAVHVSKDGNLIVGTKDNQVVRDAKINGKFTAKNIDVKENITAGGDITAKGKVTAAAVVDNTTKKGNYIKEGATVGNNLNILDDAIKQLILTKKLSPLTQMLLLLIQLPLVRQKMVTMLKLKIA